MSTDSNLLSLFWDLASVDPSTRLTSTASLLSLVKTSSSESIDYIEKRLIRGLCSSRAGARQGFSTALTEFWTIKGTKAADCMDKIENVMQSMGGSRQEVRDVLFGKLFGLACVGYCGCLDEATEEECERFVNGLIQISKDKSYLGNTAMHVLLDTVTNERITLAKVVANKLKSDSVDCLAALIALQTFHDIAVEPFGTVLDRKNWDEVINFLKETSSLVPIVHSVWPAIFGWFRAKNAECLLEFWERTVEALITSSPQRRFLLLKITNMLNLPLTPSLVKTIAANLKTHKDLFKMSKRCLERLEGEIDSKSRFLLLNDPTISKYLRDAEVDVEGGKDWLEWLIRETEQETSRYNAIDQIVKLVKGKDKELAWSALEALVSCAKNFNCTRGLWTAVNGFVWSGKKLDEEAFKKVYKFCVKKTKWNSVAKKEKQPINLLWWTLLIDYSFASDAVEIEEFEAAFEDLKADQSADVVLDILLNRLLVKQNHFFRRLAILVFEQICDGLSREGIDSLLEIVESKDANIEESDGEGVDAESEDSEESEVSEEEESDSVEQQPMKRKLEDDVEEELEERESLPDLDDDQMEAFDKALVAVFKQRKMEQQSKKNFNLQTNEFKAKALELLQNLVSKHAFLLQRMIQMALPIRNVSAMKFTFTEEEAKQSLKIVLSSKSSSSEKALLVTKLVTCFPTLDKDVCDNVAALITIKKAALGWLESFVKQTCPLALPSILLEGAMAGASRRIRISCWKFYAQSSRKCTTTATQKEKVEEAFAALMSEETNSDLKEVVKAMLSIVSLSKCEWNAEMILEKLPEDVAFKALRGNMQAALKKK